MVNLSYMEHRHAMRMLDCFHVNAICMAWSMRCSIIINQHKLNNFEPGLLLWVCSCVFVCVGWLAWTDTPCIYSGTSTTSTKETQTEFGTAAGKYNNMGACTQQMKRDGPLWKINQRKWDRFRAFCLEPEMVRVFPVFESWMEAYMALVDWAPFISVALRSIWCLVLFWLPAIVFRMDRRKCMRIKWINTTHSHKHTQTGTRNGKQLRTAHTQNWAWNHPSTHTVHWETS